MKMKVSCLSELFQTVDAMWEEYGHQQPDEPESQDLFSDGGSE